MEAEQCLICLEKFTEDSAYIPELECECAIFVHWTCWEPWEGGCLYCRERYIDYEEPVPERGLAIANVVVYNDMPNLLLYISMGCFVIYFYMAINYSI